MENIMFGIFNRKRRLQADHAQAQLTRSLEQLGASVLLITQSGKVVMVSDSLRSRPHDWLGGQAIEVMISCPGLDPYFIYYENEGYYYKMAGFPQSLSDFQEYESYRSNVSQVLCMYLVLHVMTTQGNDIQHPQMSYSHNRIHTNVIAYVDCLSNWYPIQHNYGESDFATERKVALVNNGAVDITDVIAIHELSPA
jgi:hypothetical protein